MCIYVFVLVALVSLSLKMAYIYFQVKSKVQIMLGFFEASQIQLSYQKSKYLGTNDLVKDGTLPNIILNMNLQNLVLEYF